MTAGPSARTFSAVPLSRLSSFAGAFVIQLHVDADLKEHRLAGRVEHVRTGDAALFGSLEDLLRFMDARIAADREAAASQPSVEEFQQ
jgi:hypothetical protein